MIDFYLTCWYVADGTEDAVCSISNKLSILVTNKRSEVHYLAVHIIKDEMKNRSFLMVCLQTIGTATHEKTKSQTIKTQGTQSSFLFHALFQQKEGKKI